MLCLELTHISACTCSVGAIRNGDSLLMRRSKLRFLEILVSTGFDALYLDANVLVLTPKFFISLTSKELDLQIGLDARTGTFTDHQGCPASAGPYRQYAFDWVRTGVVYMRGGERSAWFVREVRAEAVHTARVEQPQTACHSCPWDGSEKLDGRRGGAATEIPALVVRCFPHACVALARKLWTAHVLRRRKR